MTVGLAWTRRGLGRDLSERFPARNVVFPQEFQTFPAGILDVLSRHPTILHSYNPTFLQSCIPTILHSFIPAILHSYIIHFPLFCPSFLRLSCSLSLSPSLSRSLSFSLLFFSNIHAYKKGKWSTTHTHTLSLSLSLLLSLSLSLSLFLPSFLLALCGHQPQELAPLLASVP